MVMPPASVIFPIAKKSVNQRLSSGPLVMPKGVMVCGKGNSVRAPSGVIFPMAVPVPFVRFSDNQTLPSGPLVIPTAYPDIGSSLMVAPVLVCPILCPLYSVNQRLPSGPAVISPGGQGAANSVTVPAGRGVAVAVGLNMA